MYKILLISLFLFSSCITQKKCNERFPNAISSEKNDSSSSKEISLIPRDTLIPYFIIKEDSTSLKALAECDSLGKIKISELQNKLSKILKQKINVKPSKDGKSAEIIVECNLSSKDSIDIAIRLYDKLIQEKIIVNKQKVEVKEVFKMTKLETTFYTIGKLFSIIIGLSIFIFLIYQIIKRYIKPL